MIILFLFLYFYVPLTFHIHRDTQILARDKTNRRIPHSIQRVWVRWRLYRRRYLTWRIIWNKYNMTRIIIQARCNDKLDLHDIVSNDLPIHWMFNIELYHVPLSRLNPSPPRLTFHSMPWQSVGQRVLQPWLFSNVDPCITSVWTYNALNLNLRICNRNKYNWYLTLLWS